MWWGCATWSKAEDQSCPGQKSCLCIALAQHMPSCFPITSAPCLRTRPVIRTLLTEVRLQCRESPRHFPSTPAAPRHRSAHRASEVPNSSTPGSHVHIGSATAHFIRKWCLIGNNTCNREGPWKITDFALYYYFHYRRCHVYFSYGADHTGPFGTLINVLSVLIGKCNNYQKTSACGITGSEMFPYNIYWATFWHSRL